jgi:IS605 OrfB family transposase
VCWAKRGSELNLANQAANFVSEVAWQRGAFRCFDLQRITYGQVRALGLSAQPALQRHAGKHLNRVRHRNQRLRAKLQRKGTKSAKRLLRKRRRKEARFAADTNHVISKRIVAEAERTGCGIALEDLKGIRGRVRLRKPQRATLHSWAFRQLGSFIGYKARRARDLHRRTGPGAGLGDRDGLSQPREGEGPAGSRPARPSPSLTAGHRPRGQSMPSPVQRWSWPRMAPPGNSALWRLT